MSETRRLLFAAIVACAAASANSMLSPHASAATVYDNGGPSGQERVSYWWIGSDF